MVTNPQVLVCIQARMGSTRLPGKILRPVLGKPMLVHMIERVRRAQTVSRVAIITSTQPENDCLEALCADVGIDLYRGSEQDLLDRHYQAGKRWAADFVAKIPSDCPLADPAIIDEVLSLWIANPDTYDYVSNYHPPTFPDGLDVEGAPMAVLETAWRKAERPLEREHTFPFIWDQPDRFRIGNVTNPLGDMFMTHRWTLDYEEDYAFLKAVFEHFEGQPTFGMKDVLQLLDEQPALAQLNSRFAGVNWYRNHEGELKTVTKRQFRDSSSVMRDT